MKNSVADPFPCPEKEWVFKRPFSRFIQSFLRQHGTMKAEAFLSNYAGLP